jgi:DNA helicase II / ATP-dependent DNA helicase PcrA
VDRKHSRRPDQSVRGIRPGRRGIVPRRGNQAAYQARVQPSQVAIFYRTNAQSRAIEDAFVRRGMPYQLVGATRFYQRREVKDMLAYLRLLHNPNDTVAFYRIINVPPRGIGRTTLDNIARWVERLGTSPFALIEIIKSQGSVDAEKKETGETLPDNAFDARSRKSLVAFSDLMIDLKASCQEKTLGELFEFVVTKSGYESYIRDGSQEAEDRWGNVAELERVTDKYALQPAEASLTQFLEEGALVADIDTMRDDAAAPTLMTLHTAKGLEFDVVFIVGLEEGLFPHSRSMEDPAQMEEERRLFYVGITRARKKLYLIHAFRRSFRGSSDLGEPSRFLVDIPHKLIDRNNRSVASSPRYSSYDDEYRTSSGRRGMPGRFGGRESDDEVETTASRRDSATQSASGRKRNAPTAASVTKFRAGDKVHHSKFGEGVVVSSKAVGDDEEVQVAFVGAGVKLLSMRFASLKKA